MWKQQWIVLFAIVLSIEAAEFFIGNSGCFTKEGVRGTCLPVKDCPGERKKIQDGISTRTYYQPKHCGFEDRMPIVCCPPGHETPVDITKPAPPRPPHHTHQPLLPAVPPRSPHHPSLPLPPVEPVGLIQPTAPVAPLNIPFECGLKGTPPPPTPKPIDEEVVFVPYIVGGMPADENEWRWMALLGREQKGAIKFFCDGVLINDQWILTAAHCVHDDAFFVRLGEYDYDEKKPIGPRKPLDLHVNLIVPHPDYTGQNGYYDLALLRLANRISFTDTLHPVCLPWGSVSTEHLINSPATLTGWGTTYYGGPPSNVLLEANVTIFDPERCDESYSTLFSYRTDFPEGMRPTNIICAGDEFGGIDACQGDSGGPIMVHDPSQDRYTAVGIVSKGHGCGLEEFPGLYAPVATELWWIKDVAFQSF